MRATHPGRCGFQGMEYRKRSSVFPMEKWETDDVFPCISETVVGNTVRKQGKAKAVSRKGWLFPMFPNNLHFENVGIEKKRKPCA